MDKLFKPWATLSPAPPKFQSCCLLPRVETGGQNKSNPTAWHITHTFFNFDIWGRGCLPILSSRFEYFVHLRYLPKMAFWRWCSELPHVGYVNSLEGISAPSDFFLVVKIVSPHQDALWRAVATPRSLILRASIRKEFQLMLTVQSP